MVSLCSWGDETELFPTMRKDVFPLPSPWCIAFIVSLEKLASGTSCLFCHPPCIINVIITFMGQTIFEQGRVERPIHRTIASIERKM
jgi:hypothetical protein